MRLYAVLVFGLYAAFGVLILVNVWFLERVREYADIADMVSEQEQGYGLYNSLTHPLADYRLANYARRRPLIVVIGSSRALQYRDYFFTDRFYNMGGLVQGVDHALGMGRKVFRADPPEVIILALDFWFFCTKTDEGRRPGAAVGNFFAKAKPLNRIMQPVYLLGDGTLSLDEYWRVLVGDVPTDVGGRRKFGITAVLRDNGFGPDGSHFNFQRARDLGPRPVAERWAGYATLVRTGGSGFAHGCRVNPGAVGKLETFVGEMERNGSRVVLIAPPFLAGVVEAMAAAGSVYDYVDELWRLLAERFDDFHNFHDPRRFGSPDCEFIDELHGGEVTHMRMLREIARDPRSALYGRIDTALLDAMIAENAGRMIVARNALGEAFRDYLAAQSEGECGAAT